jgi:hypothetical protein
MRSPPAINGLRAAPDLGYPDDVRLCGRDIHHVELAARNVLHQGCRVQEYRDQGITLARVGSDLAIQSKFAHIYAPLGEKKALCSRQGVSQPFLRLAKRMTERNKKNVQEPA